MGRSFAITSLVNTIELNGEKTGEVTLTVTNKGGRPMRGMARLIPIDATRQEWLSICDGEPERAFDQDGTHQYKVRIVVPADTPKGTYAFRMDFVSSEDPDGDSTQGPAIAARLAVEPGPPTPSKFPWWILIVVGAVLLVGGVTTWIVLATRGPSMVDVPDVVGKTVEEANKLAEEAGLTTQLGEEQDKPGAKPGTVVEQKPAKGEKAEKSSAIVISAQKSPPPAPEMVDVPDVKKRTVEQAKLALFEKGFTPKEGPAEFKGGAPGIVIDQRPAAGAKAARGSVVMFIPEAESLVVPDVRSKLLKDAVLILQNAKFEVELQMKEKAGAPADTVFEQKPGPNERALAKTTVTIWIPKAPTKVIQPFKGLERLKVEPMYRAMVLMPPNSISAVKPSAEAPASVISGESVHVSFSYTTTHGGRGSINVQFLSKGARTPGSTELNFPLSTAGKGDVKGPISVTVQAPTHVDQIWIRMFGPDRAVVAEARIPVQLQFWPRK